MDGSEGAALSDRERDMLAFESRWWRDEGAKAEEIRRRFGVAPVRYYQQLNALIARPESLDVDPVLVRTLLRRRDR
ncbi:MAG: DUF3263 domain-containing protein [Corynebacterium sp.]|uniref:DUF3263 domain-containing protein n=1 Tax=Corynebacterium sp. TaxID=1720 RepID=UPI003F96ECE9